MTASHLPEILEVKRTLPGALKEFPCRLVERGGTHAVLLYVASTAMTLHGLELPVGTITFAHYWTDRSWNVYHWMNEGGATIGYYVNIADQTVIEPHRLEWRDLAVDILATPGGSGCERVQKSERVRIQVLDRDELPSWLPEETRAAVDVAVAGITASPEAFFDDIERRTRALWPVAFGGRP